MIKKQKNIYINKRHSFWTKIFNPLQSKPRKQTTISYTSGYKEVVPV